MVNENVIKGKWTELKGEVQKTWGQLTGDDLDQTKGDMKSLGGLIRQKLGLAEDEIQSKLDAIVSKLGLSHKQENDIDPQFPADKSSDKSH